MPISFESFKARVRIDLSFIVAGLLLLAGLALLLYQYDREERDNEWVLHTYQVIDQLKTIEGLLVDAETGVRGYVATGDSVFLEPYQQAMPNIAAQLNSLPSLVADNPAQQRRAKQLNRLAQGKVETVKELVRPNPSLPIRQLLALGKQRMDAVRKQVARMIAVEYALLKTRRQQLQAAYRTTRLVTGLLMGLSLMAFGLGRLLIRQEHQRRLQAQQSAQQSAQLLQNVIDNVPSGIVLYKAVRNPAGQVVDFVHSFSNPANDRLTGRSAGELHRLSLLEQYPANHTNGFFAELVQVVQTGEPIRRLIYYEDHGIRGWFDAQYAKQDDGVLFTYLDVTKLKEAQLAQQQQARALEEANEELQRSNQSLQSFAYVASHDLQEPLRKIQAFGDILQQQYAENLGDGVTYIERMQSAAKRMSVLIHDLLSLSRVASGRELTTPVALGKLVDTVLNDLELVLAETGAQLTVDDLPTVAGDATQLSQLFGNLLGNALKFRQPGQVPVIRVSCQ